MTELNPTSPDIRIVKLRSINLCLLLQKSLSVIKVVIKKVTKKALETDSFDSLMLMKM